MISPPVVHDLQFGTYAGTREQRGRHASWPCWCGLTRSHGLRAGAWVRLGNRAFWCCLQRPYRAVPAGRRQKPATTPFTAAHRALPPGAPQARTGRLDGLPTAFRLAVVAAALSVVIPLLLILIGVDG